MVLSNYKCMHIRIQNSRILFQQLQVHSSNVSSNRIKIQVILLILQLETDYFSSYSFQKSSIRSSGTTVFTETSRTAIIHEEVLQDSSAPIPAPILHVHITLQSREFSIQNPILHAEDRELFEYCYYISRKEIPTHRRQGDLLEIHPCVLQGHSRHSAARPSKGIQTFRTFQSFMTFQPFQAILQCSVSPGNPPHSQHSPIRMHILHILRVLQFLQFDWFPQKTPPSTS